MKAKEKASRKLKDLNAGSLEEFPLKPRKIFLD